MLGRSVRSLCCNVNKSVCIIDVPMWEGQGRKGTEMAPETIRNHGLEQMLQQTGWTIHNLTDDVATRFRENIQRSTSHGGFGQVNVGRSHPHQEPSSPSTIVHRGLEVSAWNHGLRETVKRTLEQGSFPLVLGGDHSLGIGSVLGHAHVQPNLCVIWIDAHADIHSSESSPSGNLHGMPVSFLLHETNRNQKTPWFEWVNPVMSSEQFSFIGLRDVDEPEKILLDTISPSILHFSSDQVHKRGVKEVVNRVLDHLNPHMDRPIHVSFDIDVLDPKFAPSTGTAVNRGLTLDEGMQIGHLIQQTGKLSAFDMVEVNPKIGTPIDVDMTTSAAVKIICSFLS